MLSLRKLSKNDGREIYDMLQGIKSDDNGGELIHERIQNSEYIVTVEVLPYVGAHNSVGKDRITIHVYPWGTATVEKHEHLESYDLPPHQKYKIIKPLP